MTIKTNKSDDKEKKQFLNYAHYSVIAFQMVFVILLGTWGGIKLDSKFSTKPIFTITLSLASVFLAIYIAIKDVIKSSK